MIYDYQSSREAACQKRFLGDYKGYLQVDGYAASASSSATLVGCMAHARRKFIDAQKVHRHRSAGRTKGKVGRADREVAHIQKLYRVEAQISDITPEEKYALRQLHALPLLMELKAWLDKTAHQTTPKTTLDEAVVYTLRQW